MPPCIVHAPDEKAAEAAAMEQFGLDEEQRKRVSADSDAFRPGIPT